MSTDDRYRLGRKLYKYYDKTELIDPRKNLCDYLECVFCCMWGLHYVRQFRGKIHSCVLQKLPFYLCSILLYLFVLTLAAFLACYLMLHDLIFVAVFVPILCLICCVVYYFPALFALFTCCCWKFDGPAFPFRKKPYDIENGKIQEKLARTRKWAEDHREEIEEEEAKKKEAAERAARAYVRSHCFYIRSREHCHESLPKVVVTAKSKTCDVCHGSGDRMAKCPSCHGAGGDPTTHYSSQVVARNYLTGSKTIMETRTSGRVHCDHCGSAGRVRIGECPACRGSPKLDYLWCDVCSERLHPSEDNTHFWGEGGLGPRAGRSFSLWTCPENRRRALEFERESSRHDLWRLVNPLGVDVELADYVPMAKSQARSMEWKWKQANKKNEDEESE